LLLLIRFKLPCIVAVESVSYLLCANLQAVIFAMLKKIFGGLFQIPSNEGLCEAITQFISFFEIPVNLLPLQ